MAISPAAPSTVTGTVASVNPKGLKLAGDDAWLNFSKYAQDLVPPERGQHVSVTLDRAGFIRSVDVAEGDSGATIAGKTAPGTATGQRETVITRLAVLKAAAEYAASKPDSKSTDVLKIAASWERWVLRSDDPTEDLTDAF